MCASRPGESRLSTTRCRYFRPSPIASPQPVGKWCVPPPTTASALVVPAHQAAPGEGDRPRAAQSRGRLLPSPGQKREPHAPGKANRVGRSALPELHVLEGKPEDRLVALRGNRVVAILEVADQDSLARDLRQIHTMINSGLIVTEEPTVPVGATVRVMNGPLTGVVGKVIKRANGDHFVAVRAIPGPRCDRSAPGLAGRARSRMTAMPTSAHCPRPAIVPHATSHSLRDLSRLAPIPACRPSGPPFLIFLAPRHTAISRGIGRIVSIPGHASIVFARPLAHRRPFLGVHPEMDGARAGSSGRRAE